MRCVLFTLALITGIACGGRAGVDEGEDDESEGGAFNGGASNGGATRGGARSSAGRVSSGGAPSQFGGAPATSGGRTTNGGAPALGGSVGSGGSLTAGVGGEAGVGGDPGCFYATQRGDNYCIAVAICTAEQREILCSYDPTTTVTTCTCFVDGRAGFSLSTNLPDRSDLCELVNVFACSPL